MNYGSNKRPYTSDSQPYGNRSLVPMNALSSDISHKRQRVETMIQQQHQSGQDQTWNSSSSSSSQPRLTPDQRVSREIVKEVDEVIMGQDERKKEIEARENVKTRVLDHNRFSGFRIVGSYGSSTNVDVKHFDQDILVEMKVSHSHRVSVSKDDHGRQLYELYEPLLQAEEIQGSYKGPVCKVLSNGDVDVQNPIDYDKTSHDKVLNRWRLLDNKLKTLESISSTVNMIRTLKQEREVLRQTYLTMQPVIENPEQYYARVDAQEMLQHVADKLNGLQNVSVGRSVIKLKYGSRKSEMDITPALKLTDIETLTYLKPAHTKDHRWEMYHVGKQENDCSTWLRNTVESGTTFKPGIYAIRYLKDLKYKADSGIPSFALHVLCLKTCQRGWKQRGRCTAQNNDDVSKIVLAALDRLISDLKTKSQGNWVGGVQWHATDPYDGSDLLHSVNVLQELNNAYIWRDELKQRLQ